jgi:tRNA threonylcarbamoyl adenosine modification protein YeaZ
MHENFLVLQSSYKKLSIGLAQASKIIDSIVETKRTPSSSLVPLAIELLSRNNLDLSNIAGIILDQGPGAFGSLRVLLSTANALGLALKKPLLGVDGLNTLAYDVLENSNELPEKTDRFTLVTILNAYNVECYYGIYEANPSARVVTKFLERSYTKVYSLIEILKEKNSTKKILFVGNAVTMYKEVLREAFGEQAFFIENEFELASIKAIAKYGFLKWQMKDPATFKLLPLYLKMQLYTPAQNSSE